MDEVSTLSNLSKSTNFVYLKFDILIQLKDHLYQHNLINQRAMGSQSSGFQFLFLQKIHFSLTFKDMKKH